MSHVLYFNQFVTFWLAWRAQHNQVNGGTVRARLIGQLDDVALGIGALGILDHNPSRGGLTGELDAV